MKCLYLCQLLLMKRFHRFNERCSPIFNVKLCVVVGGREFEAATTKGKFTKQERNLYKVEEYRNSKA